ncbi:glycosyltransferase family 4 protein [Pseudomonas sp.]|uniref:glycosyltransferase family 4 protein n=1 Tax=Pseudomonas sp. TaxID=306 RepID=UPI0028A5D374|nr:glycosyltransferase family 4 protein [Pseudomonas sp.]
MRILLLSQYFWPENFIINDIVRNLVAQGHEVVVATGKPNYPDGKVFPGYRVGGIQRDFFSATVEVFRVPVWPRGKGGARNLILNYVSFVLSGLVFFPWLLRKREFDTVFIFAPSPITQAVPGIFLKWLKKAHLVLWIQDLWPESLAATRFITHPYLLKLVGCIVKWIYEKSDILLVQSLAFVEPVARYARSEKIIYYPNSIDVKKFSGIRDIPLELANELERHFCVVFAGNLGTAQAVETLVEAAIQLKSVPDVRLILVGSGSRLAWLQEQKRVHRLDNLILPGFFPMGSMPQIFVRASVLLVSLKDEEVFAQTIPSKIQAYLSAGRPIIASLNGEGARIIREARAGDSCEAENPTALATLICSMKNRTSAERRTMGLAGKAYFYEHFEMSSQVARLVKILETYDKGQH